MADDDRDGLFDRPTPGDETSRDRGVVEGNPGTAGPAGPTGLPPPSVDSRANAIRRSRNRFEVQPTPTASMSSRRPFPVPSAPAGAPPGQVAVVAAWFEGRRQSRERFRWALRDSLDELMDGQRTGRWCYQHLSKTEKTYLGTAVEINLTKEFSIAPGAELDWDVAGADLDCKFSKDLAGWEIPMEMYRCPDHGDRSGRADHPALLVWFDDDHGRWAAGVLQITDDRAIQLTGLR